MSFSASLSQAVELDHILAEIKMKLIEINALAGAGTTSEAGKTVSEMRFNTLELYILIRRTASALKRLGLPEDVENAIDVLQRMSTTIYFVTAALYALQAATPLGYMKGILMLFSAFSMVPSWFDSFRGHNR